MQEIFDGEEDDLEPPLHPISEIKADCFDEEYERNVADMFEKELREQWEDETTGPESMKSKR